MGKKIRRIHSGNSIYNFQYNVGDLYAYDISTADVWLEKQRHKKGFLAADHTVEDIDNPDYVEPTELAERESLEDNKHKVMKLVVRLAHDINTAHPALLRPRTKKLMQELKELLRP